MHMCPGARGRALGLSIKLLLWTFLEAWSLVRSIPKDDTNSRLADTVLTASEKDENVFQQQKVPRLPRCLMALREDRL